MQLTLASAALIATAVASTSAKLNSRDITSSYNSSCRSDIPTAKVVNRCDYPINIWSIEKELGCPAGEGFVLNPGEFYHENLRNTSDATGISIKISKYSNCGGKDLTQLEYYLNHDYPYRGNYLDISFVDCTSGDCPGWNDGFYFKAGNQNGQFTSAVDNEHCPIFNVANSQEAAKVAYVKWNDRQTKWCDLGANMEFYLCGSDAPGAGSSPSEAPSYATPSSTEKASPSSTEQSSTTEAAAYTPQAEVSAAEVTPAPVKPNIKTEYVYETVYVKQKRHAHGHRHQKFRA